MLDVSRYFTEDKGDDTIIIVESHGKTIHVTDDEAIQLIKKLFQALEDNDQCNLAMLFSDWLQKHVSKES